VPNERFLQWVQLTVLGQSLDRGNFLALSAYGKNKARMHNFVPNDHTTSTTVARLASTPGSRQAQSFPKHV